MIINERQNGSVVILDLEGKILLGEGDVQLKDYVTKLIDRGVTQVLLNMEGVPYLDSSGLGEMVRCYTALRRIPGGGKLKLSNLTKRLLDLLTITKLITIFETYNDESEALKSFEPYEDSQN